MGEKRDGMEILGVVEKTGNVDESWKVIVKIPTCWRKLEACMLYQKDTTFHGEEDKGMAEKRSKLQKK